MWWKNNKIGDMHETQNNDVNLNRIPSVEEQQQRNPRAILDTSPSTIGFETANLPQSVLDVLNDVYSNRTHRRCIDISYCALLSMTIAVIIWVSYWLISTRCEELQSNIFICDLALTFEILILVSVGIAPLLFIFMIYSWINYSCYNPFDLIRENFVGFKLEGNQWKQQLDYYYKNKKSRCFNCFRRKQREELNDRAYGYIILSPYGIVIDELSIFSSKKNIIDEGIVLDHQNILKLTLKKSCARPWKRSILIHLPEDLINQLVLEELMNLLKIQINMDAVHSISV
jgi:hypothetical protein